MKAFVSLLVSLMLCLCVSGAMAEGYPESAHPYDNDSDISWPYTHPEAAAYLAVTFSADTEFESNYDYLHITDNNGITRKYSGTDLQNRTVIVPGNSFELRLTSDGSATRYGFAIVQITVVTQEEYEEYERLNAYTIDSSGVITAYTGLETKLVIPAEINGVKVTGIDSGAFRNNTGLTSVVIPEGVTSIGDGAFRDCSSLESIDLPDGLTSIGEYAFYDCSSLVSIDLPDGLTSIGEWAFFECSSLESIDLPDGVTSIGNSVFRYCISLESIDLPDGLTSIGDYAFSGCISLVSIDLPDGLTSIGNSAFSSCSSLASIDLPEELASISDEAFRSCDSLVSICLPDGLTSIGNSAFRSCDSLVSIDLPEGLTSIGNEAFRYCHDLSMIHLPNSVETIGENAFENCDLRSLTIPESITSIPHPIADNCDELTSVVLPKELTEIAENAFPDSVMKVYCYKGSAADTWAKDTGKFAIYLDSYDIEKDVRLITPESDGWVSFGERVFEVGRPIAWKKDYCVAPQAFGQTYTLRCESSDPSVAKVEGERLTFLKNGHVTLTVTVEEYPELSSSREIEVYYPVEGFTFPTAVFVRVDTKNDECPVVPVEDIIPQDANPYFGYGSVSGIYDINETRQNKVKIWPLDTIGVVRARVHSCSEYGFYWDDEPYAQFNLVTYDTVNAIAASAPSRNLETGETYQPDITVTVDNLPFMNEPAAYTLKSSKTSVVKPTDDGRLEAVAPGTATITATTFAGGKTAKFSVTVVKATTLNIPVGTKKIEMEAFMSAAAGSVVIPDGCESIGARAFKNCANMRKAEIPNSVTSIADDAFDGCAEGFVIIAPAGSYAAEYAVAHGYTE